jgi:SAM-dependent methyltransferase
LPSLSGKNFLDLGCGMGWYARFALSEGASQVLGIDVSEKMIAKALELTSSERKEGEEVIEWKVADLETVQLGLDRRGGEGWDVVFSSLALHYIVNLSSLFTRIFSSLNPGGTLVFSVEHPIYTAPSKPAFITVPSEVGEERKVWPLNSYLAEGERTVDWLGEKGVRKQHRTIGTYVSLLLDAGFEIKGVVEWGPSLEMLERGECDWVMARERPIFLLIKVLKPLVNK